MPNVKNQNNAASLRLRAAEVALNKAQNERMDHIQEVLRSIDHTRELIKRYHLDADPQFLKVVVFDGPGIIIFQGKGDCDS